MTVALIPARGGSKRLPRKNLQWFAGRPLICYSIAFAHAIEQIDRCVVSTEDPEIANVARSCGAEIIKRPHELASDIATTASVVRHALQSMQEAGHLPEIVILLQPNCPLRPRALAVRALEMLAEGSSDSVISVTAHHQKTGRIENDLFVPEYVWGTRSQDMPTRFFENGLLYAAWTRAVLTSGSIFGSRARALVTEPLYALGDIDTPLDLAVAEFLFEKYRSHFDWAPAEVMLQA